MESKQHQNVLYFFPLQGGSQKGKPKISKGALQRSPDKLPCSGGPEMLPGAQSSWWLWQKLMLLWLSRTLDHGLKKKIFSQLFVSWDIFTFINQIEISERESNYKRNVIESNFISIWKLQKSPACIALAIFVIIFLNITDYHERALRWQFYICILVSILYHHVNFHNLKVAASEDK